MQKYEFYNLPIKYADSDYKEAIDHIIEKYSSVNGLLSIYSWGGPSIPGISDLDFIFVFDIAKARPMPFNKRMFYVLNEKHRYIARHPFFYIDEQSFKNIKYAYPNADLKLLYGKKIAIKNIGKSQDYFSRLALLIDIITRHYPRDFLEQEIVRKINARDMLLRLNSLRVSIKAIEFFTRQKNKEWNAKSKQIEKLRKNWFNKNDFEALASLNRDAVEIGLGIAEKTGDFLNEKGIVNIKSGTKAEYNAARNRTLFVGNWNVQNSLNEMLKLAMRRNLKSILPLEFAPQIIEYSKHNGPITNYIKKNLKHDVKYDIEFSDIIEKRAEILNNQAKLASRLKHSDFVAFFDFGYRSYAGINNLALNILKNLRD